LTAKAAPVVWADIPALDSVEARSSTLHRDGNLDFDLSAISTLRHAYVAADGTQVLVLKSGTHHLHLIVRGARVTMAPVRIVFEIDGVKNVSVALRRMAILAELLAQEQPLSVQCRPGPVEQLELRDALIGLDGKCAGASHRDIANIIYGADRVEADWPNPDSALRQRVKRHLARGRRIMSGDYRALLVRQQAGSRTRPS
jgi:hypothetical protein